MNWQLVAVLASSGVVMGLASVLGWTDGIEGWLWLAIAVFCIGCLYRRKPPKLWLHGFFIGLTGGGVAPLIQALFFGSYVTNNPQLQEDFAQIPGSLEPRYFVLLQAPVAGLVSGAVLGTLAWLTAKILTRRSLAAQQQHAAGGAPRRR